MHLLGNTCWSIWAVFRGVRCHGIYNLLSNDSAKMCMCVRENVYIGSKIKQIWKKCKPWLNLGSGTSLLKKRNLIEK